MKRCRTRSQGQGQANEGRAVKTLFRRFREAYGFENKNTLDLLVESSLFVASVRRQKQAKEMYEQLQQRKWRRKWPDSQQESEWKTWHENRRSWDAWSEWKGPVLSLFFLIFRLGAQWISSGGVGVLSRSPGFAKTTLRYIKQHSLDSKCAHLLRTPEKMLRCWTQDVRGGGAARGDGQRPPAGVERVGLRDEASLGRDERASAPACSLETS